MSLTGARWWSCNTPVLPPDDDAEDETGYECHACARPILVHEDHVAAPVDPWEGEWIRYHYGCYRPASKRTGMTMAAAYLLSRCVVGVGSEADVRRRCLLCGVERDYHVMHASDCPTHPLRRVLNPGAYVRPIAVPPELRDAWVDEAEDEGLDDG